MGDLETMIALLVGFSSLAIGVFFGLRGFRSEISTKLSSIEKNTESVKKIEETAIRIDERIDTFLKTMPLRGTAEGTLKNLGKTKVTAEPGKEETTYRIWIEKPVLKGEFLDKMSKESGFEKKEIDLFGKPTGGTVITQDYMIMRIPCTDPKICSDFITQFLKWLDSEYWEALDKVSGYEKITF